ncbi:MAG TPA: hypothetical protein VGG42_09930 [Acidobacteriaceae bacterium]|jgi:hypothetical protein
MIPEAFPSRITIESGSCTIERDVHEVAYLAPDHADYRLFPMYWECGPRTFERLVGLATLDVSDPGHRLHAMNMVNRGRWAMRFRDIPIRAAEVPENRLWPPVRGA